MHALRAPCKRYISTKPNNLILMSIPPLLLLTFNRPQCFQELINTLRNSKPPTIYINVDGPRASNIQDLANVQAVQDLISSIDWDCQIHTRFLQNNYGCKLAVETALDWFFSFEEAGIILEDDCIPNSSFFDYSSELLTRFFDDSSVAIISANLHFNPPFKSSLSYHFSIHGGIWGWATWASVWHQYRSQTPLLPEKIQDTHLKSILYNRKHYDVFRAGLDACNRGDVNSWAIPFSLYRYLNGLLTIRPSCNLVRNAGFFVAPTNTKSHDDIVSIATHTSALEAPLQHPPRVTPDSYLDLLHSVTHFHPYRYSFSWFFKLFNRLLSFLFQDQ